MNEYKVARSIVRELCSKFSAPFDEAADQNAIIMHLHKGRTNYNICMTSNKLKTKIHYEQYSRNTV